MSQLNVLFHIIFLYQFDFEMKQFGLKCLKMRFVPYLDSKQFGKKILNMFFKHIYHPIGKQTAIQSL